MGGGGVEESNRPPPPSALGKVPIVASAMTIAAVSH